ncbi:unnamed protein product [Durusdinium trenchii]|uniref:Uncharacterized protein n=2 Tax=Durusdinium trenchii TaxID=1381693 RepID=A0ABP0IXZ1_9DINO
MLSFRIIVLGIHGALAMRTSLSEDVPVAIEGVLSTQDLKVNGMKTGCTYTTHGVKLTCRSSGNHGSTVDNAFNFVVNCTDLTAFDHFYIEPGEFCGKMVYTQHRSKSSFSLGGSRLKIDKGTVTDFTCVLLPVPMAKKSTHQDWNRISITVPLIVSDSERRDLDVGFVDFRTEDALKVDPSECEKAVEEMFDWDLQLNTSTRDKYVLEWTSQPRQVGFSSRVVVEDSKTLPVKATSTLKDVMFKDLAPRVVHASSAAAQGQDFADRVKLVTKDKVPSSKNEKNGKTPDPEKHLEEVELHLDASQLPKRTKEIEVAVMYVIPTAGTKIKKLKLQVESEKEEQQKESKKDSGCSTFRLPLGLGLLVLYTWLDLGAVP